MKPLIGSIIEHAIDWRNSLGNIWAERTCDNMIDLKNHIQTLRTNLDRNIKGLIDFKTVMQTISIIQSTTLTIEYKVKEMQETFSVLQDHSIKVSSFIFILKFSRLTVFLFCSFHIPIC